MYRVDINNKGDYSFGVISEKYEFRIDASGEGVRPPDALLAGLGTCIGVYLRKYAKGHKLNLPEFSIAVWAEFNKGRRVSFQNIKVEIDLKGAEINQSQINSMKEFIKNCPLHNTIEDGAAIEIKLT